MSNNQTPQPPAPTKKAKKPPQQVGLKQLIEEVQADGIGCDELSKKQIFAVIDASLDKIVKHLQEGKVVSLGGLGAFSVQQHTTTRWTGSNPPAAPRTEIEIRFSPAKFVVERIESTIQKQSARPAAPNTGQTTTSAGNP